MIRCPACNCNMKTRKRPYIYRWFYLGDFDMLVCPKCLHEYSGEKTSRAIEKKAKEMGLFGKSLKCPGMRKCLGAALIGHNCLTCIRNPKDPRTEDNYQRGIDIPLGGS